MWNEVSCVFAAILFLTQFAPVCAADHKYDGQTVIDNFKDTDANCSVRIDGRSTIQGAYDNADGQLVVPLVNGRSELVLKGKCKGVRIEKIDGQSFVDISRLEVGEDGVTVADMNGQSRIICWTSGVINVKSADGQCTVFYKPGAKSTTGNLNGQSRIIKLVE